MDQRDDQRYDRAVKRVKELKEFYIHVGVYLIVNAGLFGINMLSSRDSLWFYWPLLGWGIGVVIHGFSVYAERGIFGRQWEERKAKDLMAREERRAS